MTFLVSGFFAVAYLVLLYIPSSSSRAYTLLYIQFEYEFNFDCIKFKMASYSRIDYKVLIHNQEENHDN